jgi:cell wall-associated NlpC family hydrolase
LGGAAAHADPQATIASKAAEAKRLAAQIEANANRVSVLDEQYDEARLRIAKADQSLNDAEQRIASAKSETKRLNGMLEGRAAELYTQAGSGGPLPELDAHSVQELGARAKYSDAAAQHDDNLIEDLSAARELLGQRQKELKKARADAEAQKNALDHQRAAVQAASDRQTQLLSQVKGELRHLIDQEAQRRERAAKAAAMAAYNERVSQQQASQGISGGSGGRSVHLDTNIGPPDPNVPAPSGGAAAAIAAAEAELGKPYRYAGAGPDSFDCSGLTMWAWRAAGVSLPHSSGAQYASLPHVPTSAVAPGDLMFFGSPIHHVGMYIGGGMMIEAPHTGAVVRRAPAFRRDLVGAARPG